MGLKCRSNFPHPPCLISSSFHSLPRSPVSKKTKVLPPLQYSPAKSSPLREKYPTATKTLISEFADGLMVKKRLLDEATDGLTTTPAEEIDGVPKQQQVGVSLTDGSLKSSPTESLSKKQCQNSSSPHLSTAGKRPSLMEGHRSRRLNWKTVLEDARKLDGYKLMYANKKKSEEMGVSRT